MTMDYDKFGHCVKCHKDMLIEEIVQDKPRKRLTAEYVEKIFILKGGARMRVAMCSQCASNVKKEDYKDIMDCIIKGWDKETDFLVDSPEYPKWTKERKESYMKEYSVKEIEGEL